jgi:hypothetical protein
VTGPHSWNLRELNRDPTVNGGSDAGILRNEFDMGNSPAEQHPQGSTESDARGDTDHRPDAHGYQACQATVAANYRRVPSAAPDRAAESHRSSGTHGSQKMAHGYETAIVPCRDRAEGAPQVDRDPISPVALMGRSPRS